MGFATEIVSVLRLGLLIFGQSACTQRLAELCRPQITSKKSEASMSISRSHAQHPHKAQPTVSMDGISSEFEIERQNIGASSISTFNQTREWI